MFGYRAGDETGALELGGKGAIFIILLMVHIPEEDHTSKNILT